MIDNPSIGSGSGSSDDNVTYTDALPELRPNVPGVINIVENSTVREERQVQTTRQVKDFSESTRVVSDDRGENPIETLPLNPPTESVKAKGLPEGSYVVETRETSLTSPTFQLTGSYGTDPSSLITLSSGTGTLQNNATVLFEVTDVDRSAGTVTLNATANIMGTDGETTRHVIREGLVLTEGATTALSGINLLGSDVSYDTEETYPAVTMSLSSGAASLFSEGNKFVYNIVAPSSGSFGRTVNVYNDDGSSLPTQYGLDASQLSDKELTFSNFYLDSSNGKVYEGDVVLKLGTGMIGNASSLAEFEAQESPVITPSTSYEEAESSTKLSEVARFYNSEGIFLLEQPETITITQGDGKTASITLYKTDTLEEVREKLNNAIGNGLGQLSYADRNKFVSYVEKGSETPQGDESVPGIFIIRSVIPGKDGELSFSGDDDLLNVLGLNTIQESEEFRLSASVYDAHSGKIISSNKKVTGNVIYDAVKGVDVELDVSSSGLKASWDENSKRFISQACWTEFIHLKDNGITFQTGANKGEDFSVQLGDMSSQALGISGVNATTREYASRSVGTIDRAINRVSSQRAKIGAYQNALEHTMENLTTTSMNLTSAESRIRDADMSKLMMKFVKLQILNQSGTSMLAQANQLPRSVLNLIQQ